MRRFHYNDYFSTALILSGLALLLGLSQALLRVDNVIYDVGQRLFRSPAPADIIIVAVDEESLSQLGRWPWSRAQHAKLVNTLSAGGASAIGLDIVFSESDKTDLNADQQLADAITQSGRVALPVLIENTRINGQLIETLPLPIFASAAKDLGRVHAALDEDGIARSIYLFEGVGAPVWQHFAQAVMNIAQQMPSKNQFTQSDIASENNQDAIFSLNRQQQKRVAFLGPPGHFASISYYQVLTGQFPPDLFKNKIVLVGATAAGMNDLLTTPVSGLRQPMAGVEFHANTLQSMRQQQLISTVNFWLNLIVCVLLALLPLVWLPKLSPLHGLLATSGYFVALVLLAGLAPKLGWWIAPSAALLPILIAYPVWSWRKLEATQVYLDQELRYLRQHLTVGQQQASVIDESYDVFEQRISQVRAASQQLRFLQNNRKETLAFISHDLRAPIASALMTLQSDKTMKSRLYAPLSQALNLAEDFLQASRAEMMDDANFKETDFAGLVHQAVDDAYQAAINKNILLERAILEGLVWVNGNFGLLHRAILNLVLNAIKFAPENTTVKIQLTSTDQLLTLTIIDYGPGIPLKEQANLFKRFSRSEGKKMEAEGAGLGLYFVRTVAEKHLGNVSVKSDSGQPTHFIIQLPVTGLDVFEYEATE